jgi:hypothetical protein
MNREGQMAQSSKMINPKKVRAANVLGSGVGRKRQELYAKAHEQIAKARKKKFFVECIAICDSIISDRLEARRACLAPNDIAKHQF